MRVALAVAFENEVLGLQASSISSSSSSAESRAFFGQFAALVVHFNGGAIPPHLQIKLPTSMLSCAPSGLSRPPGVIAPSTSTPLSRPRPRSASFNDVSLTSPSPAASPPIMEVLASVGVDTPIPAPAQEVDPAGSVVRASAWGLVNTAPMKTARAALFQNIIARWLPLGAQSEVTASLIASTLSPLQPTSPVWAVAFGSDTLYPEAPDARKLIVNAWLQEKGTDVTTARRQQEERRAATWANATAPTAAAAAARAAWVYSEERSARFNAAFERSAFGGHGSRSLGNGNDSIAAEATSSISNEKETQLWMRARSAWMKLHSAEYSAAQARAPTQLAGAWMALHGGTEARAAAAAVNLLDLEVNIRSSLLFL
jgi:hypothetical protein